MSAIVNVHDIDRAHAKLSASGSAKWLVCTPSAQLEDQFPDEGSMFAEEGTFAHAVFEQELSRYLGLPVPELPADLAAKYDSPDLHDHVKAAFDVAVEKIAEARARCKDPVILLERRLDFSRWVPEGFGTGDLVIITDDLVEVCDLKFGKGIPVDAVDNSQMRLYALGAYNELASLYDIKRVRSTVLQPRLDNYSSEELTVEELLAWADAIVVPQAKAAWEGAGEFVPGAHCTEGFCRARFQCAARHQESMAIAKASFALVEPALLSTEQIVQVLDKADLAIKWLNDVKEFAAKEAERGVAIPHYKLVEGRSNRKYVDQDLVAQKLIDSGVPAEVIYERSLLGITAMEKAIGKKKFGELLNELVEKPAGKPVLVHESDKRPAINGAQHFTAIAETETEPAAQ